MELIIPKVSDFALSGDGGDANWDVTDWQTLTRVGAGASTYATKAKTVYSETGIYFLVDCEDERLTCTLTRDNADIYNEDVVEVFLWPSESEPVYFEYEISPLGYELPLLVSNIDGVYHGWSPWHYEGERLARRAVSVRGGDAASMARIAGWTAEFFLPFALLQGLRHVPPTPGAIWRANINRMDHDTLPISHWAWCPDTGSEFHYFQDFGTFRFG